MDRPGVSLWTASFIVHIVHVPSTANSMGYLDFYRFLDVRDFEVLYIHFHLEASRRYSTFTDRKPMVAKSA